MGNRNPENKVVHVNFSGGSNDHHDCPVEDDISSGKLSVEDALRNIREKVQVAQERLLPQHQANFGIRSDQIIKDPESGEIWIKTEDGRKTLMEFLQQFE